VIDAPRPLRPVLRAELAEGCTGLLRGTRSRWWRLSLACGCVVDRPARYTPALGIDVYGGYYRLRERSRSDVLPAPKRAACEGHCKPSSNWGSR